MAYQMRAQIGGVHFEPNVTPMIDVMLVLLIIFMVFVPQMRRAIDLQLPDPSPPPSNEKPPPQIVLEVKDVGSGDVSYLLNKQPYTKADIAQALQTTYDGRPDKIIFIKGDTTIKYSEIIFAADKARGAGVKVIGAPPKSSY